MGDVIQRRKRIENIQSMLFNDSSIKYVIRKPLIRQRTALTADLIKR
jgi:hypothetical protein